MKGLSHRISIPSILEVGKNNLASTGNLLKKAGFTNCILIFSNGIEELFGSLIINSIKNNNIKILSIKSYDNIDFDFIGHEAFSLPAEVEVILGIGGGKAIDIAKFMAFLRKKQFISIPTSTSNDGFSSSGASLLVDGKRTSVPAKMAYGIIVDIDVIKSAPEKFIYSGIGDLLSNITAITDWVYEEKMGTAIDDFAVMISRKAVNSFVRTKFESIKDDFFLKELVDSLTLNGISMEIAGNSGPASGSEHLISHALDKMVDTTELHGIQVGIATYIMSKVQNHRYERITKVLDDTGFFKFVATRNLDKKLWLEAIDMAPSIKPNRNTYIHVEKHREKAKELINTDPTLIKIFN